MSGYLPDSAEDIFFIDDDTGWIGGTCKTTDGGITWTRYTNWTSSVPYKADIAFVDPNNGWAAENDRIVHTTDGGQTWTVQKEFTSNDFYSGGLFFLNESKGWVAADGGRIFSTTNGGNDWEELSTGTSGEFYDIYFTDDVHGWASGSEGILIHTTDGGASWRMQDAGSLYTLSSISFIDSNSGWIVSQGGEIIHTINGGQDWRHQTRVPHQNLEDVDFVDAQNGWAVGFMGGWVTKKTGVILHTTDGGASWSEKKDLVDEWLYGVSFPQGMKGWIVGTGGTVYNTIDAGEHWNNQTSTSQRNLFQVSFLDESTGWIAEGPFLNTSDGGAHWNASASNGIRSGTWINAFHFIDSQNGWAIGDQNSVYYTTDGGLSWTFCIDYLHCPLLSLFFINAKNGWIAGGDGFICHTEDGGKTWTSQNSTVNQQLWDVAFVDDKNGWAVGDYGTIVRTTDGGKTWTREITNTRMSLSSVSFIDRTTGYAVGSGSLIMKFSSSDTPVPDGSMLFTAPSLSDTVIYPDQEVKIRWQTTDDAGAYVRIDLYHGETYVLNVAENAPNNGGREWIVPFDFTPGTDWRFLITSTSNPNIYAWSNNFTVVMLRRTYTAPRAKPDQVPAVDGNLDDAVWSLVKADTLDYGGLPEAHGVLYSDYQDALVSWKAVWCKETNKLYVAVSMQDDSSGTFDNEPASANYLPYHDESLEFYTDATRRGGDYFGLFSWAQQWRVTGENHRDVYNYPDPEKNHQEYTGDAFVTAVQKGTHGNWTCEAVFTVYDDFPNAVRTLAEKDTLGWELWYNDSDNHNFNGTYYTQDHQLGWCYQGKAWRNSDLFGNLVLGPEIIIVGVQTDKTVPLTDALYPNYPNPFNPDTRIRYALSKPGNAELKIYDVTGRLVRVLITGMHQPGTYNAVWDGRNGSNLPVSAGVYIIVFKTEGFSQKQKLTLLK